MRRPSSRRGLIALTTTALLCAIAFAVPGTTSGFSAKVTNSTNTAASTGYAKCADYFTYYKSTSTSYFEYPLTDASASTTAVDSSANNVPGTYSGTMAAVTASPTACPKDAGSAWVLDGSTNYLSSPTQIASPGPQTFTIGIWFKTSTAAGKLIGYGSAKTGDSGQYDRHLYITSNGTVAFGTYNNGVQVLQTTGTYTDGLWHQAVGTFSASTGMCLYVDGAIQAGGCNTSYKTAESSAGYWRVGEDNINGWTNQPSSYYFKGSLRFAEAYKTVLSAGEVQWQYAIGKPG